MSYSLGVHVFERLDELFHEEASSILTQRLHIHQHANQMPSHRILKDEIELSPFFPICVQETRFALFNKIDDMPMALKLLQHLNFIEYIVLPLLPIIISYHFERKYLLMVLGQSHHEHFGSHALSN